MNGVVACVKILELELLIDPISKQSNVHVDTCRKQLRALALQSSNRRTLGRMVLIFTWIYVSASDAPCHDSSLVILLVFRWYWADQGRASVAFARVFAAFAASADETLVQIEIMSETSFS